MNVVITGASAGIGRATARAFAARGASVVLVARGRAGLEAAANEVEAIGGRALARECDVADAAAMEEVADLAEERFGPIDVWVNNAMVSVFAPAEEITAEEYRRVTEVTYLGSVFGTLAALRRMRPRDRGVIVQVGSSLAYRGIPLQAPYCAAKHAIRGFLDAVRSELRHAQSRVKVVTVHLPAVNTPQFDWTRSRLPRTLQPLPPIFQPEIAAENIVYGAFHPGRRELWVGVPTVATILAARWFPRLLDGYLARIAWDGQMTDAAHEPRADNLFEPLPGDHGAHGRFDARARTFSVGAWVGRHRAVAAGLLCGALALGWWARDAVRRRSSRHSRNS